MAGSRHILIVSEDPRCLSQFVGTAEYPFYASSLFCVKECCNKLLQWTEGENDESTFYSIYYAGKESITEWKPRGDEKELLDFKQLCESQLANPETSGLSDPNPKYFYEAMKKLKESVTENDIVTILWFVPSFRLHVPSLAVQADSQKAPFLYHGFHILQENCLASDLFIISGEQSNDLAIWTRLFECTSCWIRPGSFPLPSQPTQSDDSVIQETNDSLVIDPSSDIAVADLRSSSHLPSIMCNTLFELPFDDFATFMSSILHLPLSPKYRFEWRSVNNTFVSSTDFSFSPTHSLSLHVTPAILSRDHSIQILHKIDSFSLLHILHLFLDSTFLSVFLPHPSLHPLGPLPHPTASYFLCSLFPANDTRRPFPALFSTSPRGCFLLLPRVTGVSSRWLQATLSFSLQNDRYVVVTDGDVASQAFHRLPNNESLCEAFHLPSTCPPLKRDVTAFAPRGEAYLRGMSETKPIEESWREKLFGETVEKKKGRETRRTRLRTSIQGVTLKKLRVPQDGLDLARSFLANGDSAADLRLFEFRSLAPPSELAGNRAFFSHGEDLWDKRATTTEKTLKTMGQKVDPGGSFLRRGRVSEQRSESGDALARNMRKIDRIVEKVVLERTPAGYRATAVYGKILDLATQLTRAVCETFFDLRVMVLPSMTVAREARRQVQHVVSSLIPAETDHSIRIAVNGRRASRLTEVSSLVESPISSREVAATPETSLMGTPSSLSVVLGHESKRLRSLPSLPAKPPFWHVCLYDIHVITSYLWPSDGF